MPRRCSLLPALAAAGATVVGGLLAVPMPSHAAAPAAPTAPSAAAAGQPLQVEISSLTPSYVPDRGTVTLTGTVTNTSEKPWRAIRVYAFMGDTPMRSAAELDAAVETPVDAVVGERILLPDTFDELGRLAPGESKTFTVSVRRGQLPAQEPGAYWFGAHALGTDSAADPDTFTDGRARTFISLVPPQTPGTERTSIVIPIRRAIRHTPGGRIRGVAGWAADLDDDGRLRSLVELGAAAGSKPVTWLVDPAVPDAVARLVAGNLPRTLADTLPPVDGEEDGEGGESGDPGDTASPSGSGDEEPTDPEAPADPEVPVNPATEPGAAWLDRFEDAVGGDEVLALPYGDQDVAAAAAEAPDFYGLAVSRVGTVMDRLEIVTEPAVAGADGFLSPDSFVMFGEGEQVLLSDAALPREEPVTTARVDDQEVVFSSSAVVRGGPGPDDPLSEIAVRQRLLAEAAVRLLYHDRTPLLVLLPEDWQPDNPSSFWSGLDADWLELTTPDDLGTGPEITPEDLAYPVEQELTQLDPENFEAARELISAGRLLDNVLPRNDLVASQTFDEALTSLSVAKRQRALASRSETLQAVSWIERRLRRIRVRAPRGVTLSSSTGSFPTLVTNRLDHPIRVMLEADSLGEVSVENSGPVELAAGSRQTVLLNAVADSPGVHYVRIRVTDENGNPLGTVRRVAIRSAEVSQVIWLILGVGVGLLFVAIAIRVVRRVRSERA
ncbi:DUF6049 family protein [Nocardioides sp.]|uniref:DUF6049 family protein n=1 Tax=Nocardioides sp. TaxID=35761 RepID=UPI002ED3318B